MRTTLGTAAVLALLAGCTVTDENPGWSARQDYPAWAYDAPYYYRPSEELEVAEVVAGGVPVYFSNDRLFFVKHASGYQLPGVPRLGVWCSLDAGQRWQRAGYFGVEQTHFLFQAEQDGPHWIRFVGPGQGIVQSSPGAPHRIYVVDTAGATIELTLDPPPLETDEQGHVTRHVYAVGENVRVGWRVHDANLVDDSVRLATTFGSFPANVTWSDFPLKLEPQGSVTVPVPPAAAPDSGQGGSGGMRFRVEARDKAGNISLFFSEVLHVAPTGTQPTKAPPAAAAPSEMIVQTGGRPGPRPGWPQPGELIRGGASRILQWMPKSAENYKQLLLQFSANNGRSWRTVAENLQAGEPVRWSLPQVNSRLCLVRILALEDGAGNSGGRRLMLAQSMPFTVHTLPPEIRIGPEPLPPEPAEN